MSLGQSTCAVCGKRLIVAPGHLKTRMFCKHCGSPYNPKTGESLAAGQQPTASGAMMENPSIVAPDLVGADAVREPRSGGVDQANGETADRGNLWRNIRVAVGMLVIGVLSCVVIYQFFARIPQTKPETRQLPVSTESWATYQSTEGRYVVKFPDAPTFTSDTHEFKLGKRKVFRATSVADGIKYYVAYFDVASLEHDFYYSHVPIDEQIVAFKSGTKSEDWIVFGAELFGYAGTRMIAKEDLGYRAEAISIEADGRIYMIGLETDDEATFLNLYQFTLTFGVLERPDGLTTRRAFENWERWEGHSTSYTYARYTAHEGLMKAKQFLVEGDTDFGGSRTETILDKDGWTIPSKRVYLHHRFGDMWLAHDESMRQKKPLVSRVRRFELDLVVYEWDEAGRRCHVAYMNGFEPFLVVSKWTPDDCIQMLSYDGKQLDRSFNLPVVYKTPRIQLPQIETNWAVEDPKSIYVVVRDGKPPYTWSVEDLPEGLTWIDAKRQANAYDVEPPSSSEREAQKIDANTLVIQGALKTAESWTVKISVTDQAGAKVSCTLDITGTVVPEHAGSAVFSGGEAQYCVVYRGEIEVTPPDKSDNLTCTLEDGKLPPDLSLNKSDKGGFVIYGVPMRKGEFAFTAVIERVYPKLGCKRQTRLPIRIVVEPGPSEPLVSLFGERTTILIGQGHTTEQAAKLKTALGAALRRTDIGFSLSMKLVQESKWVDCTPEGSFDLRQAGNSAALRLENQDFSGKNARVTSLLQVLQDPHWPSMTEHVICVSPLSDCDTEEGLSALKLEIAKQLVQLKQWGDLKPRFSIVTARTAITEEFKAWLAERAIALVQIK